MSSNLISTAKAYRGLLYASPHPEDQRAACEVARLIRLAEHAQTALEDEEQREDAIYSIRAIAEILLRQAISPFED